jgi:hypothetical protein
MKFNVKQLENGKIFNVTFRRKNGAIRIIVFIMMKKKP